MKVNFKLFKICECAFVRACVRVCTYACFDRFSESHLDVKRNKLEISNVHDEPGTKLKHNRCNNYFAILVWNKSAMKNFNFI